MSEAVGGCRLQTHGVGGPSTAGNLCQIAGRPRAPAPTQVGTEVGHLIPFPAPGLRGGCGGGGECLESQPRAGAGRARRWWWWRGSSYLRPENGAPPTLHAALPPGSRSPRQSSAQVRGPPMLRPAPSAHGPSSWLPPACRPRPPAPPASPDARIPVPSAAAGGRAGGGRGAGARVPGLARPLGAAPRPLRRRCQPGRSPGGPGAPARRPAGRPARCPPELGALRRVVLLGRGARSEMPPTCCRLGN